MLSFRKSNYLFDIRKTRTNYLAIVNFTFIKVIDAPINHL